MMRKEEETGILPGMFSVIDANTLVVAELVDANRVGFSGERGLLQA